MPTWRDSLSSLACVPRPLLPPMLLLRRQELAHAGHERLCAWDDVARRVAQQRAARGVKAVRKLCALLGRHLRVLAGWAWRGRVGWGAGGREGTEGGEGGQASRAGTWGVPCSPCRPPLHAPHSPSPPFPAQLTNPRAPVP